MILRFSLLTGTGLLCLYAFIVSFDFPEIAGYFPRFGGGGGVVLAAVSLLALTREALKARSDTVSVGATAAKEVSKAEFIAGSYYIGWVAALVLLTYLFGILIAAALWLPLYTAVTRKIRWVVCICGLVGLEVALFVMQQIGVMELPMGIFL